MKLLNEPRGFRNNNPGNIRISHTLWKGEVSGDDQSFEKFETIEYGIRAIWKVLATYQAKGYKSTREIITRWSPPSENDTDGYVARMSKSLNLSESAAVSLAVDGGAFIRSLIETENGICPFSVEFIVKCRDI